MTSLSFLGLPDRLADGQKPCAAIFGAAHGTTYPGEDSSGYAGAANAIRGASQQDAALIGNWDFDLGGPLFDGGGGSCIDTGDIANVLHDNASNRARIEAKTRDIVAMAAVPIMLGGDNSVPIPFFAGFVESGPVWILQIDAHMDWRDEVAGERLGYSNTMRRASEMAHVAGMVQVGMRGVGSARQSEIEAARQFGSRIVTAREVHTNGVQAALAHIPEGARVVITLDCDGLDPAIMPGVAARSPGGLAFTQVTDLISGVAKRAKIAGFDLVELYPPADVDGLSARVAARILVNVIGSIVRQA